MPFPSKLLKRIQGLSLWMRLLSLALAILVVGVGIGTTAYLLDKHFVKTSPKGSVVTVPRQVADPTPGPTPTPTIEPVSPYIFGTNMSLFDIHDQVLNSAETRALLQQMHMTMMRMPVRENLSTATEVQAAQVIKSLGEVPLLVLPGSRFANALSFDTNIIQAMNQVFGNSPVYYEFGNEDDLHGMPVSGYTSAWNTIVPQLKKVALNGKFIGPVNYQYNHDYLNYFLQHAQPLPDAISWHEYTCDAADAASVCIAHIANWTTHIADARAIMQATVKTLLPIMITEWNYAPDAYANDGKNNDPNFLKTWTTQALQTLAANRVFASMQYSCTNTAIPLITPGNQMTMQGEIFQAQYTQMIVQHQQPAPVTGVASLTPTATAAVTFNGPLAFSFEDGGLDGWTENGQGITNLQNSTDVALNGSHSLMVTLSNISGSDFPYIAVNTDTLLSPPQPGQTISAYVYMPSNSVSLTAKLFVVDQQYHWASDTLVTLQAGVWTHLTCVVPPNVTPRQLGIQFNNSTGSGISTSVYVDAIGWQ
jgi:hypothetical protein